MTVRQRSPQRKMFEEVKEQFCKVIAYSQGIPEPKVDDLFDTWLEAKRDFIEAFGGKLIYEIPFKMNFALDEKDKISHFNNFVDVIYNNFFNDDLGEFLEQESCEGFFTNTVTKDYESKNGKIPKGMKLVKAFKFFEKDKKMLEALQDSASRVIQENKVEGTLCFSVHPLDYLSSSENTYNWRSCHALDGEFRSGNLSYMVDSSTLMCYLKGADNIQIPMFPSDVPWNSKKWRVLLFFSKNWDMIFAGRQYPFSSTTGLDVVKEELSKIICGVDAFTTLSFGMWDKRYASFESTNLPIDHKYVPIRGELFKITDIIKDRPHSLHFNDLLSSSVYLEPFYTIRENYPWSQYSHSHPEILIGGEVKCLHCGQHPILNSETMMCDDCELEYGYEDNETYGTCDCCGARIIRDDAFWVGDDLICGNCYEKECFICECCDEVYYKSDLVYDKEYGAYSCQYCYTSRREK